MSTSPHTVSTHSSPHAVCLTFTMALADNPYTQLGHFAMRGEEDLVWKPEGGEEVQESIESWTANIDKMGLLVLASLAGRISVQLTAELTEREPDHQWCSMLQMTEPMPEDYVQQIVKASQPGPPGMDSHYLTPPNIKGRGLAADAVQAIVNHAGTKTLASTISSRTHQSKKAARQAWQVCWRVVMGMAQGVGTEGSAEEREDSQQDRGSQPPGPITQPDQPSAEPRPQKAKVSACLIGMLTGILDGSSWDEQAIVSCAWVRLTPRTPQRSQYR